MKTLIRQEIFKLEHQISTWVAPIVSVIIMTICAIISKVKPQWLDPTETFTNAFYGQSLLVFFLIVTTAKILTTEFQFGTIKGLLYRKYYRGEVFGSKIIALVSYGLANYCLILVYGLVLKVILFGNNINLVAKQAGHTPIQGLFLNIVGSGLNFLLIMGIVLLVASLFKTGAAAITVGILGYFAASILQIIQILLISKWDWIKWNPINMLNAGAQLVDASIHKVTSLSTPVIVSGSLIYTLVLIAIAYLIFRKRNV